jgi:topoisomerase-4 subunit A
MRLRSLRKLEEMEIRTEHDKLSAEKAGLEALLASDELRWKSIADEIALTKKKFGQHTELGRRRTDLIEPPSATVVPLEAVIEREPITVLLSEKGWIRAIKGHADSLDDAKFKDGDQLKLALHAQTTDKILVYGTNGRFYTILGDRIQRGRGFGEPVRLVVDLPNDAEICSLLVHQPGRRLLLAAKDGRGFVVSEDDVVAQTRSGKQALNVAAGTVAAFCVPIGADDDSVAVLGDNRKLLIFDLEEVPQMSRGRGVIFQRYTDGGVADLKVFANKDGFTFKRGEQTRTEADTTPWRGKRASAGKLPPQGFPRSNRFGE